MSARARGRRAGNPDTRSQILSVAQRRLLTGGDEPVSLRAIAAEAGVDPALIVYYFGSKQGLLTEALNPVVSPAEALAQAASGDLAGLPDRVLRHVLVWWEAPESGAATRQLLAAATRDRETADLLRARVQAQVVEKIADQVGGPGARDRASALCAQIVGLLVARYIIGLEPLASMPPDQVVRNFTPALSATLGQPPTTPRARR